MMEVADISYWKELNYHDGLLYCQLLEIDGKNDWRVFKDEVEFDQLQYCRNYISYTRRAEVWFESDITRTGILDIKFMIIPVRDC